MILQSKHVLLGVDETMVGRHQTHAYGVLCENMLITSRVFFTDIIMETDYQNLQGKNKGILHLIFLKKVAIPFFLLLLEGITKLTSDGIWKKIL